MKVLKYLSVFVIIALVVALFPACDFLKSYTIEECYNSYNEKILAEQDDSRKMNVVNKNEQSFDPIKINYFAGNNEASYSDSVLKEYMSKTAKNFKYAVLYSESELPMLAGYSLEYFAYAKTLLEINAETIQKSRKKSVNELYENIQTYFNDIQDFKNYRSKLEEIFTELNKDDADIIAKLDNLTHKYIRIIKDGVKISESAKKCLGKTFTVANDYNVEESDAREAMLSAALNEVKFIVNYYEQYIEFNGVTNWSTMPQKEVVYAGLISNKIFTQVSGFDKNFASISSGSTQASGNQKATFATIKYLKEFEVVASQMETINNSLDSKHFSQSENEKLFQLEELFKTICNKSVITNIKSSANNIL